MKERPLIFGAESVRAILAGSKSQTRRVVKQAAAWAESYRKVRMRMLDDGTAQLRGYLKSCSCPKCHEDFIIDSPYGVPGDDRLWVRETWHNGCPEGVPVVFQAGGPVVYRADVTAPGGPDGKGWGWRPSIYMPRWASRITLEVVEVRVDRLQGIRCGDIRAEGIDCPTHDFPGGFCSSECGDLRAAFADAWDDINGKRPGCSWAANPWCWAVTFKRLEAAERAA